jgi:DNA helicase-2/ATP-dependent DNA helicase PcrA
MIKIQYGATEIFSRMLEWEKSHGKTTKIFLPTLEQIAIIEADPFNPSVVIAGAGSGKTETMGARVLWLVANGIVRPDEILGLTFTRKAAGELAVRIRNRLRLLRKVNLIPLAPDGAPLDLTVTVSTYHSYAGKVLAEHAIRMGIDTDSDPIGQAAAWQIANEIIANFENTQFPIDRSLNSIIDNVMELSGQIGEHATTTEQVRNYLNDFLLEFESISTPKWNEVVRSAIAVTQERLSILPMVDAMNQYRMANGLLTFNDQMSLAAELACNFPEIGATERSKFKIVLLDEYQDTSYSQIRFLSHLFTGGHPVTAVGDPNQGIYGWRSASPDTMATFSQHFPTRSGAPIEVHKLLTTWRNDQQILVLANRMIDEIAGMADKRAVVDRLQLRDGAGAGLLHVALLETVDAEAHFIATEIAKLWNEPIRLVKEIKDRSTFAVLVRNRGQITEIQEALRDAGIPVDVVGLGGLVELPEIADTIALLRTVTFSDSGSSLMRLLTGPRVALGAKDLAALGSFARSLAFDSGGSRTKSLELILESGDPTVLEADDFATGSIVEALEIIDQAPITKFTSEGLRRLITLSKAIKTLRRSMHGSIVDAISLAEEFLGLDVEVLVRDGWQHGRRHLDKFMDEGAKFARTGGTLSAFLRWLEVAESEEGGLKLSTVEVNHEAVQILTIHQSKGAEWDVVVVPGLAERNFPNSGKKLDIWTKSSGSLPVALRGDKNQLPDFQFPSQQSPVSGEGPTAAQVSKALTEFENRWKAKILEEELRLAYVAFTRAKTHLFVTTSWFRSGELAVNPSLIFQWVAEVDQLLNPHSPAILRCALDPETLINPEFENPKRGAWPRSIAKSEEIAHLAHLVGSNSSLDLEKELSIAQLAFDERPTSDLAKQIGYIQDAKALLTEILSRSEPSVVLLPSRLSVSTLLSLAQNPIELASWIRRPMPSHTDIQARRGTQFHLWLERTFNSPVLFEDDALFSTSTNASDEIPFKELQEKWLQSEWAGRKPIAVEIPFETVLAGVLLRGRIDAVYQSGDHVEIVDWKTGRTKSDDELKISAIQLAIYRLAYSKLHAIELKNISAAFYYVGSEETIRPADLYSEVELISLITQLDQA